MMYIVSYLLLFVILLRTHARELNDWLLNDPVSFHRIVEQHNRTGLVNITGLVNEMKGFVNVTARYLNNTGDGSSDLEIVDVLEHFFWGMSGGVALELGAVDGTPNRVSMTFDLERSLGWTRMLIEANPKFRKRLQRFNPEAYTVHAAVCETTTVVHFGFKAYCSGIVEFMEDSFLRKFFPVVHGIYSSTVPAKRWDRVNWKEAIQKSTPGNPYFVCMYNI
jgi:hypothetical protein